MNTAAIFDGIKALLDATPVDCHDSDAPLDADGQVVRESYFILFDLGPDELEDDRHTANQSPDSNLTHRVLLRSTGLSAKAARHLTDAGVGALVGEVITVEGRVCDPIMCDPGSFSAVKRDTDVSPPLYFRDVEFTVMSRRA